MASPEGSVGHDSTRPTYDALLLVSFGGPEGPEDVLPFLENVLRGKNVPRERMLEVADHYQHFGGVSPINDHCRQLLTALRSALDARGITLPLYWGNRNWHPMLTDTLAEMSRDGVRRALAFVTSSFSSYSGCRQYRENIAAAQGPLGEIAPVVDKIRVFYNHPGFVSAVAERAQAALDELPPEQRAAARLVFTAHSIPNSMASGCRYEAQLQESCRLVSEQLGRSDWALVYQSRSGPPTQPWLEPDVCDYLRQAHQDGLKSVVVVPIGFLSDHIEVLYDLDTEARGVCEELGIAMVRAATVGIHPKFIDMICQLIAERLTDQPQRLALGSHGPSHDVCPVDCCLSGRPVAVRPH